MFLKKKQLLEFYKIDYIQNNHIHEHKQDDDWIDMEIIDSEKYKIYYTDSNAKRVFLDSKMNLKEFIKNINWDPSKINLFYKIDISNN